MSTPALPTIHEESRRPSPVALPQALAAHGDALWISARDQPHIYALDRASWKVTAEHEAPGVPWSAVSTGTALAFTIGKGAEDDRYWCRFTPGSGFQKEPPVPCPDFTGSYLSHDGTHLYLSQWYRHRILELDDHGAIVRELPIDAEICGHTFRDGWLYVLRGTEKEGEAWTIARLDPRAESPVIEDLGLMPFACRSLTFDGQCFWTNHRAAGEIVSFTLLA